MKIAALLLAATALAGAADLKVTLRSRYTAFKNGDIWRDAQFQESLAPKQTAILICDMWDKHWCRGATERVDALVKRMAPVVDRARRAGIQIIHSPSDVVGYYTNTEHAARILPDVGAKPPNVVELSDPPLPIDDSDGGCDTDDKVYTAWTKEHAGLTITGDDVISDRGPAIYAFLQKKGIKNLLVMGVHTNMCVLNRTFAIKQMTRWGIRCILVRDLTDAMYDPKDKPYVTHQQGTELVIQHIEKYWCPSMESADLMRAIRAAAGTN